MNFEEEKTRKAAVILSLALILVVIVGLVLFITSTSNDYELTSSKFEPEWVTVTERPRFMTTRKLRVENGWLYLVHCNGRIISSFVPDIAAVSSK